MSCNNKIVVFDRDPDFLKTATLVLSEKFNVSAFSVPPDLTSYLHSNDADIIIADLRLLPVAAKRFITDIKSIVPDIPIILMGVSIDHVMFKDDEIAGHIDASILKPFDIDHLFKVIDRVLAKSKIKSY